MRRYLEPSALIFAMAIMASLGVHFPVYEALGKLADILLPAQAEGRPMPPSEPVTFELSDEPAPPTDSSAPMELPARQQPNLANAETIRPPDPQRQPTPKKPTDKKAPAEKPPPEQLTTRQAVQQKSRNPEVEAPENARFIAEENQRVEEQTVARLRNLRRDDPTPSPGAPQSVSRQDTPGNASKETVADTQGKSRKSSPARPSPSRRATGESGSGARSPAPSAEAGNTGEENGMVVHDGIGSFRVSPKGRRGSSHNLRLSWSQFQGAVGAKQLEQERDGYASLHRQKRSSAVGQSRESWEDFRGAIENYVPNVKAGNQTALNAAKSPFANYLAAVHRNIHREFAERFLRGLPSVGSSQLADRSLMTRLEIVLNRDGSVHKIGVVNTSGALLFDHGAFMAVRRGQPYPEAPSAILSGDGRVYFHWGFYRNERQCGTFNARPYILPNPQESSQRDKKI